ncbi:SRPBCC family protein [Streptacidiphilus sp. N1-12]|uniref:SRPBCC family protein n=2 Tax=Streptacidiphilus alkalitolerans TaxID=3342712 RepID=A0ABV6WH25_9ACTN
MTTALPGGPSGFQLHRYRFTTLWDLPAPPARVYAVLGDPRRYPVWWPEIREVRQLDPTTGLMRFRSLLPYELAVVASESRQDPAAGVLEARLTGDLEGTTRWTVTSRGDGGSVAVFEEDVEVHRPLMRRLALPGRPAFRLNHALMMKNGRKGLTHYLSVCARTRIGLDQ